MKKILDVNLRRKLRRKNQIKKYFKIFLLFLTFFVTMFGIWQFSLKKFIFLDKDLNFPIFFSGDSVLGFEKTNKGFCVLTNNQFNFYKKDGSLFRNILSNNPKTQIDCFGDNVLWYEKGSKNFSIQNENKIIFSGVLQNPIVFGKIFKNKIFAIVTKSENYFCELIVFNKKNEEIFKWSCADGLIVDFDIASDGGSCVVTTVAVRDGVFKSYVYEISFSNNFDKLKKEFTKETPIAIRKFGALIVFICDSKVLFLDSGGSVINSFEYAKDLYNFTFVDSGGYVVLCLTSVETAEKKEVVVSYDRLGNKVAEYFPDEKIKKIKAYGSDILMLTDSYIIHTNVSFKNIKKIENLGIVEDFIYDKPYFYYVSMNKVNRILFK